MPLPWSTNELLPWVLQFVVLGLGSGTWSCRSVALSAF